MVGRSALTGTRLPERALVSVVGSFDAGRSSVFNLTVADQPEFFANGVLVHNCADALRYLVMAVPASAWAVNTSGWSALATPLR